MIEFKTGDILKNNSEAIVNTVNCVGVMGKGLALQFKKAYPDNYKKYKAACNKGQVQPGKMFITHLVEITGDRWIVNFPTKKHWKSRSKISDIEEGLTDLIKKIEELNIRSIAIPPLGSGLGGLEWNIVCDKIVTAFRNCKDIHVVIYEPKGNPKANAMTINTPKPKMTRGRALLIKLLECYFKKEYECSKIEAQKLAYFLQETGIDLRLRYVPHHFGPYADNLNHVLERMDGHFITGYGDRVTCSEIKLVDVAIEEANLFLKNDSEAKSRLSRVEALIDGYETPLSMEVLATVHWVLKHEKYHPDDFTGIKSFVHKWNERKASWRDSYLKKAISRLTTYNWV